MSEYFGTNQFVYRAQRDRKNTDRVSFVTDPELRVLLYSWFEYVKLWVLNVFTAKFSAFRARHFAHSSPDAYEPVTEPHEVDRILPKWSTLFDSITPALDSPKTQITLERLIRDIFDLNLSPGKIFIKILGWKYSRCVKLH